MCIDKANDVLLDPLFIQKHIADLFRTSWSLLAEAAGYNIAEVAVLERKVCSEQAYEFLVSWLAKQPPSSRSQPKALLSLVERTGMEQEALELRKLFLGEFQDLIGCQRKRVAMFLVISESERQG